MTTIPETAGHLPGDVSVERLESVNRMKRDIVKSATTLSAEESRYLVKTFYNMQDRRKAADQQANALDNQGKPNSVIEWLADQDRILEQQIQRALDAYTASQPLGIWAREQTGIGPIIAAGLMAYIRFDRVRTAGGVWRYAGQDPTNIWYGREKAAALVNSVVGQANKYATLEHITEISMRTNRSVEAIYRNLAAIAQMQALNATVNEEQQDTETETPEYQGNVRRTLLINYLSRKPWNAQLKLLCWKIGDSFCKTSNNPNSFYGPIYKARKAYEQVKNANGDYRELAALTLREKNITEKNTRARYEQGQLPDGRIELRSRRYATKLFLSHFFEVGYVLHHHAPPPVPYVIGHMGHIDYIPPPHLDVIELPIPEWWHNN